MPERGVGTYDCICFLWVGSKTTDQSAKRYFVGHFPPNKKDSKRIKFFFLDVQKIQLTVFFTFEIPCYNKCFIITVINIFMFCCNKYYYYKIA